MPRDGDDSAHLWDMLRYSERASELVQQTDWETYQGDWVRQLALERALEIVGEAARRVSAEYRSAHPEIPWRRIIAHRNVLAHEYGEIRQERLWVTATDDVPALVAALRALSPDPPRDHF